MRVGPSSGIRKECVLLTGEGNKAEICTRVNRNSSRRLSSTSCALTRKLGSIKGSDTPSVDVHRLHGSEMNRFPHSNKRDQEPVFDRRMYVCTIQQRNQARSRNIEPLPKVSQVSPSQGRCRTISIPKGTTGRRSRALTSPSHANCFIDLNPERCGTSSLRQQGAGPIGSYRGQR